MSWVLMILGGSDEFVVELERMHEMDECKLVCVSFIYTVGVGAK